MNANSFIHVFCFWLFSLSVAFASDIQLRAFFQPSRIHLGENTQYVMEISGDVAQFAYQPPPIEGLRFSSSQNMQSIQLINGRRSVQLTKIFHVQAKRMGSFTIPSQSLSIQGKNHELPSATLHVLDGEEQGNEEEAQKYSEYSEKQAAQLSVILPTSLYVGQVVPIQIELKVPASHSYNLLRPCPTLLENTWINGPFSKPYEISSTKIHDNDAVYRWDTTISAPKSGELSIQYSLNVEKLNMGWFSFFSDKREEQLFSKKLSISVRNLPSPQPSFFGGSIGHFSLTKASISDSQALLEEPLTLRVELKGEGNWERMLPPELLYDPDEWRIYPPKRDFHPSDTLQYSGKVSFNYVILPLKTGQIVAPQVAMSYFDLQAGAYQTLRHEFQEPIFVSRTEQVSSHTTIPIEKAPNATSPSPSKDKSNLQYPTSGHFFYLHDTIHVPSLTPLYLQKCFWLWQLLPLTLYLVWISWMFITQRRAKFSSRDNPKRHSRRLQQCFKQVQKALNEKQIDLASKALQDTLYAFLAYCKISNSRSMTYGEIQKICGEKFKNSDDQEIINHLCQHLELQHFSSSSISLKTLQEDFSKLKKLFQRLS